MTPLLSASGVAIAGRLQPTELTVEGPALVGIVGPNGGGKTSLLRALAGVEHSQGRVTIDGEHAGEAPPVRRARLLSFLPASRDVAWPISARDVVGLGLPAPDDERVEELLHRFVLTALAGRPVDRLSTGERSRVLLARALAARPRLLLLDEPLSNLDPYWVLRTLEILRHAIEQEGCAALVTLHDLTSVEKCDRALLVSGGRIVADCDPAELFVSGALADAFGIERKGSGWQIRRREDRRSSP